MENSALRSVFGSTASLAELSGDTQPTQRPPGYSRFGLNERPPSHKMHIKTRRGSVSGSPKNVASQRQPKWQTVVVLVAFGILQAVIIDFHTPFFLGQASDSQQTALSFVMFVLSSLVSGLSISQSDREISAEKPATLHESAPLSPKRHAGKPPVLPSTPSAAPASPTVHTRNHWFQAVLRGYGILLGLVYLSEQLPGDAGQAWLLIVPSVWFVSDRTLNGLAISTVVAVLSAVASLFLIPGMQASTGIKDIPLYTLAGFATTFFATSSMAGGIGRGMR